MDKYIKKCAQKYTSRDSKTPMFSAFLYQNYLIFYSVLLTKGQVYALSIF